MLSSRSTRCCRSVSMIVLRVVIEIVRCAWGCTSTCGTRPSGRGRGRNTTDVGSSASRRPNGAAPRWSGSPSTTSSTMVTFRSASRSRPRSRRGTSTIRIGSAVALLPLHLGVEMAEQVALCDVISDGRMEPGFGVGYRKPEYLAFEGDFKGRYRRVRRAGPRDAAAAGAKRPLPTRRATCTSSRHRRCRSRCPSGSGSAVPTAHASPAGSAAGSSPSAADLLEPYRLGLDRGGHEAATAKMAGGVDFLLADDPERAWNHGEGARGLPLGLLQPLHVRRHQPRSRTTGHGR